METSHHHFSKPPLPADDRRFQFELYTVHGGAGWFSWDNIHEIEKASLKEFFGGSSVGRNPRVYKEYRDFIISKFREDPSRRLTFSEVRKSLDGSVVICTKCFKTGAYGDNKCVDDYKFVDHTFTNGVRVAAWSEAETLLLLESMLKHGDDWVL